MAEASQDCHERKAEDNTLEHCRNERHTNLLTSNHQDKTANVLPPGTIPKESFSQPSDIPFVKDDGNKESTTMAECTLYSTNIPPATELECQDYPSWSLPRLPNNLQSNVPVTSNSNRGAHTYNKSSSTVRKVNNNLPPQKREVNESALASGSETPDMVFEETSPALAESDDSVQSEARPPTPEASGHSADNSPAPFVTGWQCLKTSVASEADCSQNIFIPQQSSSPTENDCHTTNEGLLQQYEKANQMFHLNEMFLVKVNTCIVNDICKSTFHVLKLHEFIII